MGIEQLVDTFKGNPQPLQAKVQKAQQSQPPGFIAPDMEEALALQEILELQKSAQNQQAIQAGGPSPTIMEKLRQMVGTARAQGQPQMGQQPMPAGMPQQPVMAARGGSIDQLMSNLGRHYANGGIIAFDGTKGSKVEDKESDEEKEDTGKTSKERLAAAGTLGGAVSPLYTQALKMAVENYLHGTTKPIYPASTSATSAMGQTAATTAFPLAVAGGGTAATIKAMKDLQAMSPEQRRALAANPMLSAMSGDAGLAAAIQEAGTDEPRENKSSYLEQIGNALGTIPKMAGEAGLAALKHLVSAPGYGFQSDFSSKPKPKPTATPSPTDPNFRRQTDPRMLGVSAVADDVPLITSAPSSKPSANVSGNKPIVTKPEVEKETKPEEMDPMETALRAAIMKSLGRDEEQEFQKGAKRQEDFMGLDKLLAPREARIAEREGMQRKIQGDRLPSWVEGLDRASKPIVSGGIGTILNNLGSGMRDQSKAYSAEDLKFFNDISDMKDEVLKLKMEGKYKAAAAGQEQIKNMLADKRQNESSGTSLLNTKAINKSREQTALEGRLSREQVAREGRLNRIQASNAQLEAKKDERLQKQRNWVAEQERKWQDTLSRNPDYKKAISMRSMQEQILMASTDPAVQDKAQANIDNLNEKIQKMLPTAGAVNIPPPPKGAVVRTG
jgi:hypothetical protein